METIPLEELRLGNLVSINNRIIEVDRKVLYAILMGHEGYEPKAIPITEDLLKRLGFWEKKIRTKYHFNDEIKTEICLCYKVVSFCLHYEKGEVDQMFLGEIELDKRNDGLDYFNDSVWPPIYKGTGLHRLQNAISEKTAFKDLEYNLNINSELIKGQPTI